MRGSSSPSLAGQDTPKPRLSVARGQKKGRGLAAGLTAALAGLALLATPVMARAEELAPPPVLGEELGPVVIKMLLALGAVLLLLAGLYWLARRFLPAQAGGGASAGMRVVGRLALGPRKGLALVELAGKVLVLGVSEQGLSLLTTVEDPQEVAKLTAGRGAFGRALKKAQTGPEADQP